MSADRPILILTASTGAGHNFAARAVEAALRIQAPTEQIEVHDVLASVGPLFRRFYGGGYAALVHYFPTAMGWLYDAMDQPNRPVRNRLRLLIQDLNVLPIVRHVLRRRPKLIVNTHYLPAEIVARLRREGRLECPQVTVTTDLETHRIWVQPPTERYYTATELGKAYLTTWDVPPEQILVTGIPIRPAFAQPLDHRTARAQLGLETDGAVVLLMGGVIGFGPTEKLLDELIRMPAPAQVIVVTGRNERLRRRLAAQVRGAPRRVVVSGFTERMHEWMSAADLMVSKPGGLISSEALACGLPIVIVNPIPGQEIRNSDYLLEHGAAVKVNHPRLLGWRVSQLLASPARMQTLRTAARALARPTAAADIARDALKTLAAHAGLTNPRAR